VSHRNAACLVAVVLLLVPLRPPHRANGSAGEPQQTPVPNEPAHLRELLDEANQHLEEGAYVQAAVLYRRGIDAANAEQARRFAIRFLVNLGSVNYLMHRYRDALRAYTEARGLAEKERDLEMLEALSVNISSLYLQLGAYDAALEAARSALQNLEGTETPNRSKLLLHAAQLRVAGNETVAAEKLFRKAILLARKRQDSELEGQALTGLGNALVAEGRAAEGIEFLQTAVELRRRAKNENICFSYETLGRAHAALGQRHSALRLFTKAIGSARRASAPVTLWSSYYERGQVNLALGKSSSAYNDLSKALQWARRWKAEVLPADAFRLSTSVELHEIYSAFLEAATRRYQETRRQHFAEAAFAVAEEIRAQSLRALLTQGDGWRQRLPDSYWETLAALHKLEVQAMQDDSPAAAEAASRLRVALTEMEARAGLTASPDGDQPHAAGIAGRIRRSLSADEAYLGFYLGKRNSYLYAVTRDGFEVEQLPPERELASAVEAFVADVSSGSPTAVERGASLFAGLFGGLSPQFRRKSLWILGLDGALFDLPFAALVEERGGRPVYLVERRAIQAAPSVFAILSDARAANAEGPFVGFGDAIYNRADPRWRQTRPLFQRFAGLAAGVFRAARDDTARQLSRLPGSGRELQKCARRWKSTPAPVLLTGAAATKSRLKAELEKQPAILHIATHFVAPEGSAASAMIATGMSEAGEVEYLSATEIANLRARLGLVIMNGCASGAAAVLPGEGLMGLTRAWLAAGARAVIASHWPVPDNPGELFESLYSSLDARQERGSFARALQQAQIARLRSVGWQASPAYWSAYFCFERN
jgi:tetratricopeptide (TPR) repeat protein